MLCYVVLLKFDVLEIVECTSSTVFALAKERNAGICGVFRDREQAAACIAQARQPIHRDQLNGPGSGLPNM